jgi:hypothetical protein
VQTRLAEPVVLKLADAETVLADKEGNIFFMEETGRISWAPGGQIEAHQLYADVGGHPLGAQFDSEGNLYVCDLGKVLMLTECSLKLTECSLKLSECSLKLTARSLKLTEGSINVPLMYTECSQVYLQIWCWMCLL